MPQVNININHQDNDGNTALIWACLKNHVYIVRMLIKAGANVNIQNNQGQSALSIAYNRRHEVEPSCRPLPEKYRILYYQEMLNVVESVNV